MNVRLTLILMVALLLIAGYAFFVRQAPSPPAERTPFFYQLNLDSIVQVAVTYSGTRVAFRKEGDRWFFDDGTETPVNIERWSGITLLLSGPRAARLLLEEVEETARASYGLDPPQLAIDIGLDDGRLVELALGNKTPDGVNQYAQRQGSPALFSIAAAWGDVFQRLVTEPPYPPSPTPTPLQSTPTPTGAP